MGKVIGIHELRLRPEVRPEDFERFILDVYKPAWGRIGWNITLLKGLRGDRPGKYVVHFEIASLDELVRYEPKIGTWTAEGQKFLDEVQPLLDKWGVFVGGTLFTDYLEVE